MASTRNKNTTGNYNLKQREYTESSGYTLYPNSQYGDAYETRMAGNGLNPGQISGHKLSHNASDIESFLFGINSTNLVHPAAIFVPELVSNEFFNIYDKKAVLIPEPLAVEKSQRPLPLP